MCIFANNLALYTLFFFCTHEHFHPGTDLGPLASVEIYCMWRHEPVSEEWPLITSGSYTVYRTMQWQFQCVRRPWLTPLQQPCQNKQTKKTFYNSTQLSKWFIYGHTIQYHPHEDGFPLKVFHHVISGRFAMPLSSLDCSLGLYI